MDDARRRDTTFELILFDFASPLDLPYREIARWPVNKVEGFQPDGSFIWDYDVEIRSNDGKRTDEMSEEEQEAFEADENYEDLRAERTIRMKWHPDGRDEIIAEVDK